MEKYNQQNILVPWVWCYHFNEELLRNISLICIPVKRGYTVMYTNVYIVSLTSSGNPYPGASVARFDITPGFIFVYGGQLLTQVSILKELFLFFLSFVFNGHWDACLA